MKNVTQSLVVGVVTLLLGLVLGWAGRGLVTYDTGTTTVSDYQDWHTACPAATAMNQNCEMVEDVLDGKSHQEIARVAVTRDNGKEVLGITMPFGVALEPGIGLIFGTDPVKVFPYRTCNTVGCIAEIPLDDKIKAQLNAGKDGRILFAGLDNKPVALPLSLKGYAQAARVYRRNEGKRTSWFWRMWS